MTIDNVKIIQVMKKLILGIIALAGAATSAQAQSYLTDNPDNRAYFGIRAGVDVSSTAAAELDSYSNGAGFTLGAVYNLPLYKNLYFEPGLSLFYDTFGTEVILMVDGGVIPDAIDGSIRNFGFRVPFHFGYHFDFTDDISIHLYTGPVLNFNILARQYYPADKEIGLEKQNYSIMGSGGFDRFDLQWDFGVGLQYGRYFVSIGGGVGMTKVYDHKIEAASLKDSFRRNTFNISLGYNF